MKVKSYLALLMLVTLFSGNGVRWLLSNDFEQLNQLNKAHAKQQLWQKDLERIARDTNQFLISTDLIMASGETHLISGAQAKGALIINALEYQAHKPYAKAQDAEFKTLIQSIQHINKMIQQAAFANPENRQLMLNTLLDEYDQNALTVSQLLPRLEQFLEQRIEHHYRQLKKTKDAMESRSLGIQIAFSALVFLSWLWVDRAICLPVHQLQKSVAHSRQGNAFEVIDSGPKEIQELSQRFAQLTDSLSFQASHDPLTKLFNRRAFNVAMAEFLAQSQSEGLEHHLCYIDLDHFKTINDSCGHSAGDEVLSNIAQLLVSHVRSEDVVARLGGDEFAILLYDCSTEMANQVANRIRHAINAYRFNFNAQNYHVGASIGITQIHAQSSLAEDIINAADIACMQAKACGRDMVKVLVDANDFIEKKRSEVITVNEIKKALEDDNFILYRQHIVPLSGDTQGAHYEVLLRMRNTQGEILSPAQFMPVVEKYNLGSQVDRWVIAQVFEYLATNPNEVSALSLCSINLSGQSLGCVETLRFIVQKLTHIGFAAHKLCFEITETAAISDIACALDLIDTLKQFNCRFALDDFGSGLSSFGYLKTLPVDIIKIDGAFVRDILKTESDLAMVKAINDVAKACGKEVIAEFVESADIASALKAIGIDYAQGYFYDQPKAL